MKQTSHPVGKMAPWLTRSFPMMKGSTSTILEFVLAHLPKSAKYVLGGRHDIEAANSLRGNGGTAMRYRISLQSRIGRVLLSLSLYVLSLGRAVSLGSAAYRQSRCHQRAANVDVDLLAGANRIRVLLLDFRSPLWLSPRNVSILGTLVGHRAP